MSIPSSGSYRNTYLFLTISLLLLGTPLAAQHFTDAASSLGIVHTYQSSVNGGGVSFCDFDGDGWDDLTLATADDAYLQFYRNTGGSFEQMPYAVFIEVTEESKQILWVDYDNDGDKDLYVATYGGANQLYRNDGLPIFTEVTSEAGLPSSSSRTFGACFGDYDRDGWLDLYYGVRIPFSPVENRHYFFRNNADGTFSEVTEETQTMDLSSLPFCSSFFDYNNDRWPDLYTAHDRYQVANTLFENTGEGSFISAGEVSQADISIDAMCVTAADFNRDGWLDIYVTNTVEGSALLMNQGASGELPIIFQDEAAEAGVEFMGGVGWSSAALDGDNDGDLDLYVSGMNDGAESVSAAYYQNEDDGTFTEPAAGFIGDTVISYNNAIGDFNNDGYADIIVLNQAPYHCQLWQNSGGENHWIKVNLEGVLSNRDGIGSRIEIYSQEHFQMRYTQCGTGFLGQHSNTQLIGLGTANTVDSIIITWPTGHQDHLYDIAAGQLLSIMEGSTTDGEIAVDPDVQLAIINSLTVVQEELPMTVYPNPTQSELYFSSPGEYYAIIDNTGRWLKQGQVFRQPQSVDVEGLTAGHYFLLCWTRDGYRQVAPWVKVAE